MNDKDDIIILGSGSDSITVTDTVTLDLDLGAAQPALSTLGLDTITLDNMSSNTITLPSNSIYTISGIGGGGGGSGAVYSTGTSSYTWNQPYSPGVNINTDGIEMSPGTDIKVDGKSLKEFMNKMEQRLAILVPDPAKLEKFEALKKAYEHYKTMERLCQIEEEDDNK